MAELVINGERYALLPSFENFSRIEQETKSSIVVLAHKLTEGLLTLEETAIILKQTMQDFPEDVIKQALVKGGLASMWEAIATMFTDLFVDAYG